MKRVELAYSTTIYHGSKLIKSSHTSHRVGKNKSNLIELVKRECEGLLERAVIQSGQITNYNRYFLVVKNADKEPWLLVEYKPTFQYKWHYNKNGIAIFLQTLGVKFNEI